VDLPGCSVFLQAGVLRLAQNALSTQRDWDDCAHLINVAIDIHYDDPEFGYRFIGRRASPAKGVAASRKPGSTGSAPWARLWSVHSRKRRTQPLSRGPPVHDDLVLREFTAPGTECAVADGHLRNTRPVRASSTFCAVKDACSKRIVRLLHGRED